MSGIAGIINLNGRPVSSDALRRMTEALIRCGPDSIEYAVDGQAGLGHAMMRTTPESLHDKQPYFSNQAGLAITADARLDNRTELIDELGLESGDEIPDCRLILAAYQKWGTDCASRLLGDFAFAIRDGNRRRLYCARDHFGVRPLCYYSDAVKFVFASEVKAVLAAGDVPDDLNEGRIADFLVEQLEGYDKISTFYEKILKLPPAHYLVVDENGFRIRQYWALDAGREIRFGSDEQYVEAFREIFSESVRCRLRGRKPVGMLLSGGIDSATILATARRLDDSGNGLVALSGVSPPDEECIETRLIREVLNGTSLSSVQVRSDSLTPYLQELDRAIDCLEDLNDASMVLQRVMYIEAGRRGATVVLDGIDADVVTSTTIHLSDLLRRGSLVTAVREARGMSRFYKGFYSPLNLLFEAALSAFTPFSLRGRIRSLGRRRRLNRATGGTLIGPDFADRICLTDRLDRLAAYGWAEKGESLAEKHARAINHPYLSAGIDRYGRVAAFHGVESAHPFLDKRLAEFCVSIPWEQKTRDGWTKYLMRRMMNGDIPESVRLRMGREHLGWSFLKVYIETNQDRFRDAARTGFDSLSEYIDGSVLKQLCDQKDVSESVNGGYDLLQAGTLALFLEQHRGRDNQLN